MKTRIVIRTTIVVPLIFLASALVLLSFSFLGGQAANAQEGSGEGQFASVNGLELYYEVHGVGEPLILLHGGLNTIDMVFGQLLPPLAENRQVIAVELQGHGHTADVDRPMSFELMADDIAALIQHLGYQSADIMGFSLGGGVAQQVAIRHPEVVRRLVLISTPFSSDGWYPEVQAGMAAMNAEAATAMLDSPMYQLYAAVAPNPDDWPILVTKLGDLLRQDYDWSEDVAAITAPILLVVGDADNIRPAHAVQFFALLGGGQIDGDSGGRPTSQLAVLPGATHFSILTRTDLLLPVVAPFLNGPLPESE